MSLEALLAKLEARPAVTPVTIPAILGVAAKSARILDCTDVTPVTAKDIVTEQMVWSETDWLEYYSERAGVAEHCGGMTRDKAERMAYESCITRWQDNNSPPVDPDLCAHCSGAIGEIGKDSIATASGHWLHHACHQPFLATRRQEAIAALAGIGIS